MHPGPCTTCRRSHSVPHAYILACKICKVPWHHCMYIFFVLHGNIIDILSLLTACLEPAMSQRELLVRLQASNASHSNPMDVRNWCCERCSGGSSADQPILIDDDEPPAPTLRPPAATTNASASANSSTSTLVGNGNEGVIDLTEDSDDEEPVRTLPQGGRDSEVIRASTVEMQGSLVPMDVVARISERPQSNIATPTDSTNQSRHQSVIVIQDSSVTPHVQPPTQEQDRTSTTPNANRLTRLQPQSF
ncbi:hypothetical protein FRC03_007478, partial [Tulasnella sp. 419]